MLDDATDSSHAVQNSHKLIDEDHVDAIIGSTVGPGSVATFGGHAWDAEVEAAERVTRAL